MFKNLLIAIATLPSRLGLVTAGLLTVLLVLLLQFLNVPFFERVGLQIFDGYQRTTPRAYQDAGVRVVDIDEESITRFGQWPWPRTQIARLTDRLTEAGSKAIAFDIVFSEPDRTSPSAVSKRLIESGADAQLSATLETLPDHDAILAESFAAAPVVNGFFLLREDRGDPVELRAGVTLFGSLPDQAVEQFSGAVQPLPTLREASSGFGSLSLTGDDDGIIRRVPMVFIHDGQLVPSLSLEALRVAEGAETVMARTSDGSGETSSAPGAMVEVAAGNLAAPTNDAGELWAHYAERKDSRIIPAWTILDQGTTTEELAGIFDGRIVFVGASAIGLRDLVSTPLADREPGVLVHAQAAEQVILSSYLVRPDWAPGLEFFLVILVGSGLALVLPRIGAAKGAVLGIAAVTGIWGGSWSAFEGWRYLLAPTYPILVLIAVYTVQTMLSFYREEQERAYIHSAFDKYLSPEMVRQIASDPGRLELGGEEREMTVLFCDIRGFSRISEQYDPKEVINFLTGFLTPMCDILLARKATVDKFIGDAILAFWNAPLDDPDQFHNGAAAALTMIDTLEELNRKMPDKAGQVWPEGVSIGIGMNAGLCCVGNMGSEQRLSYSLIGDTVNIASRFEGLTKYYGASIIIGSAMAEKLEGFALLELDLVRVVGREAPDRIFALLGDESVAASDAFVALMKHHEQFLDAYRAQDWAAAEDRLEALTDGYADFGLAKFAPLFRERTSNLRSLNLGADWDGVFQAQSK